MGQNVRVRVNEIKPGMRDLQVEGEIISIGEAREINTKYGPAQIAEAVLRDETGSIKLNLWRDQIRSARVGASVRLVNAFAKGFGERAEISIGRDGKIVVLEPK